MAKARAIVKRLRAVRNIRKITRTMELIATARFKKAMDRATEAAAYTQKISEIVADLSQAQLQFTHPLLRPHEREETGILLVISSNRGFAGGYNASVLRQAQLRLDDAEAKGQQVLLEVVGKRGINMFRFQRRAMDRTSIEFGDRPAFEAIEAYANRYIELYISGKIDRLDVAYMRFDSASRQTPVLERLLPIGQLAGAERKEPSSNGARIEYEFQPSAQEILEEIVPAAFKARLFKCFLDASVSEQIFRMVAMKGATENADEMIRGLSRKYNRARQSQITSELSEIIGGAAALE